MDSPDEPSDTRGKIVIVFDGACLGNPGPGGYAALLVNQRTQREKVVSGGDAGRTTNNRMELTAAIAGLNGLRPGATVTMLGDSEYVVKGFREWLPGWKARGWRTGKRKPVLNRDLWERLEAAVERHAVVRWDWTRGHAGHELNERVDSIASDEARRAAASDTDRPSG